MATYIPNATQTTEPVESRTVESAALEFRTLKASINARIEDVQDDLDAEIVNRIAGDANLQTQNNSQDVRLAAVENALLAIGEGGLPGTVYVQRLSGTGAQTVFTLNAAPQSGNVVDIYINGIYQNKDTFTVTGADVTFSEAPPAGTNNIEVQVTVTIALGETDASLVTYDGTTVEAQLDAVDAHLVAFSTPSGAALINFQQAGTGAVVRTVQDKMRAWVSVKDFGAVGDGVADDTAAIQDAIASIRTNPEQILDTIGGSLITVYTSGTIYFPKGVYLISPDALQISQDIGLKFAGDGSRRTNNAEYGASTLLVSAASTGFAIQAYRSGGRGLTIEDMDICYSGAFTGSLVDVDDAPGLTMNRCYVGTYGITGATRQVTAAACIRSTYDEFMTFDSCVFNGAQLGWWIDNARTFAGNTFGGSITKFDNCVFYDFAVSQIYSNGTRTKIGMNFVNCAFNPISVAPSSSAINVDNVDGFNLTGCVFNVSVGFPPASQWLRATNCTGNITGTVFGDLAPAALLSGQLHVSGNQFAGPVGPTLVSGVITGSSNEFSKGAGWVLSSPTDTLSIDIGPDLFKPPVTYSYDIPADNALFSGRVNYAKATDASVNKFRNTSGRISIIGTSDRLISTSSTPVTLSILETGNTYLATGGSAQAFTLPAPVPGTRLCVSKISAVNLSVTCAGGTNFYGVGSTYPSAASLTGAAMGTLELEAYSTVGWVVKSLFGSWSFT